MLDPVQDSRSVQQEMPVVEMLREIASECRFDRPAIWHHAEQINALADSLSALTPERVAWLAELAETGHEAICAMRPEDQSDNPPKLSECASGVCKDAHAALTALGALAGSTTEKP